MLCNNCGKSLDGKAALCGPCTAMRSNAGGAAAPVNSGFISGAQPAANTGFSQGKRSGAQQRSGSARANQSTEIPGHAERAPRFRRFTAAMVDASIFGVIHQIFALLFLTAMFSLITPDIGELVGGASNNILVNWGIGIISAFAVSYFTWCIFSLFIPLIYFGILESGRHQATLGKRLVGIKVINSAGQAPSFKESVTRYITKYLWAMIGLVMLPLAIILVLVARLDMSATFMAWASVAYLGIGCLVALTSMILLWKIYVTILFNPTGQGLADRISGCYVVRNDRMPHIGLVFLLWILMFGLSWSIGGMLPKDHSDKSKTTRVHFSSKGTPDSTLRFPFNIGTANPQPNTNNVTLADGSSAPADAVDPAATPKPASSITLPASRFPVAGAQLRESTDNLVTFGTVKRYFPTHAAFVNPARTEMRIYLGQGDYSTTQLAKLARHDVRELALPQGADLVFVVEFASPIQKDCSFDRAKRVSVLMYRSGITGFPLPGTATTILIKPNSSEFSGAKLNCIIKDNGSTVITGTLRGSGKFSQGQAVYPLVWNVQLESDQGEALRLK